jgi:phosphoribosylformylglycinamidine cyclo-ligase
MDMWTYSRAGVDLNRHRRMHSLALKAIRTLSEELGIKVTLEGYGSVVRLDDVEVIMHTDGVGTKTLVLEKLNKLDVAGWDCVAMNVNDVACAGSRPIILTDYISMPKTDEEKFLKVLEGVVRASRHAKVLLVGGETAIMPDLINGIDVVCTVLAIREKFEEFKGVGEIGDVLVGVRSNGPHANGYSLIRKVLETSVGRYDVIVDGFDIGEWLSRPTAIYSGLILEAAEKGLIKAAAHITGGAFSKVRRILPPNADAHLELKDYDEGFEVIRKLGNIPLEEMYRVFNMGIGLVLSASSAVVDELLSFIKKEGFEGFVIGRIIPGSGRIIINVRGRRFEI